MLEQLTNPESERLAALVGASALEHGLLISVAESLTGGQLSAALAASKDSSEWFRGGLVAYQPSVKYDLLGVPEGPVVNGATAQTMAQSCLKMFRTSLAVAVTGVGGPGPEEGDPAGTVFIAVAGQEGLCSVSHHFFEGDPTDVLQQTITVALSNLQAGLSRLTH